MRKLKFNGKDYNLPTTWGELSFVSFIRLQGEDMTDAEKVSALLNESIDEVTKSTDTETFYEIIRLVNLFMREEPAKSLSTKLKYKDNTYEAIQDIGLATVAQFEDVKAMLKQHHDKHGEGTSVIYLYPKVVAIWMQPIVEGAEYNYGNAMKISEELYHCSALEVVGIGNFFLSKLLKSTSGTNQLRPMKALIQKVRQTSPLYIVLLALRRSYFRFMNMIIGQKTRL